MEDLILKLLKENGRIIIPDFGAFILKTKSPFTVIFNEFLQYNDGALIGATEEMLKINRDDAVKKVEEFADEIISKLEKGETIALTGIGVLNKSTTGKITLSASEADVNKEKTDQNEKSAPVVEFDIAETKNTTEPTKEKAEPPIKKENKPAEKAVSVKPATNTTKQDSEIKKPGFASAPTIKKEPVKQVQKEKQTETKEPTPIAEYYEDNSSRNKLSIIIWAVLIVIVNGTIFFIFDDELKAFFGYERSKKEQQIQTPIITNEETPAEQSLDTVIEEELIIEDTPEETNEIEQSNALFTGKKYYVVAGVFKEESNADNLVLELQKKGYNSEKFGKIGTLHAVSYEVFPTKPEADRFMLKIKREVDSEAWIRIID